MCGPELAGGLCGVGGLCRYALHDGEDGNRHQPVQGAADEDQNRNVEAYDVTDTHQGRREIRSEIGDRPAHVPRLLENATPKLESGVAELERSTDERSPHDVFDARPAGVAHLQHFGCGNALGEAERRVDDQSASQRDGKQHTHRTTQCGDERCLQIIEFGPRP